MCRGRVVKGFASHFSRTDVRSDLLIIQGDWNAEVGHDVYKQLPGKVGRFGVGETNERGEMLSRIISNKIRTPAQNDHGKYSLSSQDLPKNNVAFARWRHT